MQRLWRLVGRYMGARLLPRCSYPVVRGPARGARFILGSLAGAGGGASVYLGLVEPEQSLAIANLLHPGCVFYDIGANVGYYTVIAARIVGDRGIVVAVEPDIRNITYLRRHLSINRLTNVSIVTAACSDGAGICSFATGSTFATGHIVKPHESCAPRQATIVPTISLDQLVASAKAHPDVIKIDVEGAELSVLQGASRLLASRFPTVLLSVHSDDLREQSIEFLSGFGYTCKPLQADQRSASEFVATPPDKASGT